jgi:D-alanyl-D-alanine carboxypeptidase/D-alanyl-D-alanine-endopeptidase (penicillin-binding protein 4)
MRWVCLGVFGGMSFLSAGYAATLTLQEFQTKINTQIAGLDKQTTPGIYMEVVGSSQPIFLHNQDKNLLPASASKLMTTTAALERLGSNLQFQTRALVDGNDLVLMSEGDPWILVGPFTQLAQQVAKAGIKQVHSIRINNSAYLEDYNGLAEFANWDGEDDATIVAATSFNYNALQFFVSPNAKTKNPTVVVGPVANNKYAIIQNQATQVAGTGSSLTIKPGGVKGNQEIFIITGTIGKSSKTVELDAAVRQAEANVASVFAGLLRSEGVTVDTDYGGVSFAPPPNSTRVVASIESSTLLQLANIYVPDSINFMAEGVFQAYGAAVEGGAASVAKSQAAMAQFLKSHANCQSAVMVNGSGLTWENEISPHCFVETLQTLFQNQAVYNELVSVLPVGGKTGTLANRFKNAPSGFDPAKVHAKTGTLWSKQVVTALVGQTQISSGQTVFFALMENDSRNNESLLAPLRSFEDQCVELLQQLRL